MEEVAHLIAAHALARGAPQYVVTPNAQHIVLLNKDSEFRRIYREAFLVVPDGMSLLWAARFLGASLKERVNGTDLMVRVCELAALNGLRVFLLGGRPGAADGAKEQLQQRYPSLDLIGTYCPPYGFESQPDEIDKINQVIAAASPHILFVGLGAPKQEKWISEHCKQLGVPVALGIGVSFEFVAKLVRRAPAWMQGFGLEWLFRLISEPRRLWRRYVFGIPEFVFLVLKQRWRA
jgi:N-acetylglucosaminyldiphosphoundecaprenol N-acetyl-beta-D-mannosaminyltransferase